MNELTDTADVSPAGQLSRLPTETIPITATSYSLPETIPDHLNGLCADNSRVFGSTAATVLVQGIVNDSSKRAQKYEANRDILRTENAKLQVENAQLKERISKHLPTAFTLDFLMGLGFCGIGAALTMISNQWKVGILSFLVLAVSLILKYVSKFQEVK